MAIFKPYKVLSTQLDQVPQKEGQVIFTTDDKKLYVDVTDSQRISFEQPGAGFRWSELNGGEEDIPQDFSDVYSKENVDDKLAEKAEKVLYIPDYTLEVEQWADVSAEEGELYSYTINSDIITENTIVNVTLDQDNLAIWSAGGTTSTSAEQVVLYTTVKPESNVNVNLEIIGAKVGHII